MPWYRVSRAGNRIVNVREVSGTDVAISEGTPLILAALLLLLLPLWIIRRTLLRSWHWVPAYLALILLTLAVAFSLVGMDQYVRAYDPYNSESIYQVEYASQQLGGAVAVSILLVLAAMIVTMLAERTVLPAAAIWMSATFAVVLLIVHSQVGQAPIPGSLAGSLAMNQIRDAQSIAQACAIGFMGFGAVAAVWRLYRLVVGAT